MPDDRLIHPRLARSQKVSALDDLQFRVWIDSILFADDRGVLPRSASFLRGHALALQRRSEAEIGAVLTHLVTVGLLVEFEHQTAEWLVHPTWREHQNFSYIRNTYYPSPPPETLRKLSRNTSKMFSQRFGKIVPRPSPSPSPSSKPPLVPHGRSQKSSPPEPSGFDRFWTAYPKKTGKGAARKSWLAKRPPEPLVLSALAIQAASEQWRRDKGRYIPNPATWLNQERWTDESGPPNGGPPEQPELRADGFPVNPVLEGHWFHRSGCAPTYRGGCVKEEYWDLYAAQWRGADRKLNQCPEHRGK